MGCIRSLSKIWGRLVAGAALVVSLCVPVPAWASFASQFSLGVGEEYTDNVFFSKQKDHDFVTIISPTLSLFYAPPGQVDPTLTFNVTPSGQIYARNSE